MNECVKIILSKDIKEVGKSLMEDLFAAYHDRKTNTFKEANYKTNEAVQLSSSDYKWIKGTITTTPGKLFFNRAVLEYTNVIDQTGYVNVEINAKNLTLLSKTIGNMRTADMITSEQLEAYVDRRDKIGFWAAPFSASSISPTLLRPMKNVEARKDELFNQYEAELNSDNPVEQIMTINKIETELMKMVKDNLKDDTGYDLYASGVGNLNNNYKTINVMRGAVFNNITKKYDIVRSSLMNGIDKKDIPAFSNSITAAAYPSAVDTAKAGATAKIIMALLQSERLNPDPKSDCGTHATIPLTITNQNKGHVINRNIDEGGKVVTLTVDNISKYVDKTVNLYSPQGCRGGSMICGKCGGPLYYNFGVTNIGLLSTAPTQKMLNIKLKSKHDLSQSAGIVEDKYIFIQPNKYYHVDKGILKNNVKMKIFIPRILEEVSGFVREATMVSCMGVLEVKFYDKNDTEILSTLMSIPAILIFNIHDDIQEDVENYIITYDAGSEVCSLGYQKSIVNVELFINQIYLNSHTPQLPYNLMTEMMMRCIEMNQVDLDGPSIIYEMLAKRVCQKNRKSFALTYGNNPNVDQMSYDKIPYREAVQHAGVLQGVLFQDSSKSINVGLAQTLNNIEGEETPLEKIINA